MRKILCVLLLIIPLVSFAQEKKRKVFCELVGTGKFMSNKVTVKVDFGQSTSFWSGTSKQGLVDENGNTIEFNSMVDAMNYMGALDWEFEQAYVVTMSGNQNVYHWLLSKDITSDEEFKDGIKTRADFDKEKKENESNNEKSNKSNTKYSARNNR
jgi:hypothetical protein